MRVPSPSGTSAITPPPSMKVSGVRGLTRVTGPPLALDLTEGLVALSKSDHIDPGTVEWIGDVVAHRLKVCRNVLQTLRALVLENTQRHGFHVDAAVVIGLVAPPLPHEHPIECRVRTDERVPLENLSNCEIHHGSLRTSSLRVMLEICVDLECSGIRGLQRVNEDTFLHGDFVIDRPSDLPDLMQIWIEAGCFSVEED